MATSHFSAPSLKAKPRQKSSSAWKSAGALLGILSLFGILSLGTTAASHWFGQSYLQGNEFSGDNARWGSVSDWFSGVVGVSIGLAGSAIAIWLAYRVEKLTVAQNQMANVQSWRETYIDSGDIAARAELAARVYELIQQIYRSVVEIEKLDKTFDQGASAFEYSEDIEGEDISGAMTKLLNEARQEAEPYRVGVIDALSALVDLLPMLRRDGLTAENVLGMSSAEVKEFAKDCMGSNDFGAHHSHQLAEAIASKENPHVHVSDAVNLMMNYTKASPIKLRKAAHESADYHPEDFSEFFWRHDAKSAGHALERFEPYIPLARCDNDNGDDPISWARAYCDFVMNEVNPYRYAREAIINDLQIGDVSPRQEKRLELLSNLAITKVLAANPYIRDVFPEDGYAPHVRSERVKEQSRTPKVVNRFEAGKKALKAARAKMAANG